MPKLILTFLALIGLTLSAQAQLPLTGAGLGAPGGRAPVTTTIFLSSTNASYTVPSDWNSANNTIEVIGAGGGGSDSVSGVGSGGGGGAYSKSVNITLTPSGTIS